MSNTILLDAVTFATVLCRPGEGAHYLKQLGVELTPDLSDAERVAIQEAVAQVAENDTDGVVRVGADLAGAVAAARRRVTFVADLEPRRSLVAFVAEKSVACFALGTEEVVASEIDADEFTSSLSHALGEAVTQGVRWSASRWEADECLLAIGGVGDEVSVTARDAAMVVPARDAASPAVWSDLLVG